MAVKTRIKETVKAQPAAEFSIRDLIDPQQWYLSSSLEEWLGIYRSQVESAEARKYLLQYKAGVANDHSHLGRQLLAWIENENVPYALTERGERMLEIRKRIADGAPSQGVAEQLRRAVDPELARQDREKRRHEQESALPGVVGLALQQKAKDAQQREFAEAKRHTEGMRAYLWILIHDVQDKTTRTDSEKLVELIDLLGLDVDTLRADRDVVERALELMGRHDKLEAANEALSKSRAKVEAVRSEFLDALDAVEREFSQAIAQHHEASASGSSLIELSRKRPEFFDDSHPPILRNTKRG